MGKRELIERISLLSGTTTVQTEKVLDTCLGLMDKEGFEMEHDELHRMHADAMVRIQREWEEIDIKLKKSKLRLDEIKSNREYQAVLKEIEDLKNLLFKKKKW